MNDSDQRAGMYSIQCPHNGFLRGEKEGSVIYVWGRCADDLIEASDKLKAIIDEVKSGGFLAQVSNFRQNFK